MSKTRIVDKRKTKKETKVDGNIILSDNKTKIDTTFLLDEKTKKIIQQVSLDAANKTANLAMDIYTIIENEEDKCRVLEVIEKHLGTNAKDVLLAICSGSQEEG